jgi:hypothetical protein
MSYHKRIRFTRYARRSTYPPIPYLQVITILVRIVSSYEYKFLKVKNGIKELGNEIVLKT